MEQIITPKRPEMPIITIIRSIKIELTEKLKKDIPTMHDDDINVIVKKNKWKVYHERNGEKWIWHDKTFIGDRIPLHIGRWTFGHWVRDSSIKNDEYQKIRDKYHCELKIWRKK